MNRHQKVVIVDYGTGNLNSIRKVLDRLPVRCAISSSVDGVANADKIIMPGVGHFATTMSVLKKTGLAETLSEAALVKRKPVLGICLGMELMAGTSEEGSAEGLGWLEADAVRFRFEDTARYKVPHMGWNNLSHRKDSALMTGVSETAEFYFAHSYYLETRDRADVTSETEYQVVFPSAIERDNIFAVQFHPEKSHDAGAHVLRNFIEI